MSFKAKGINSVSQILEDLKNGLTRTPKDKQYDPNKGSIMEKYNLNATQVKLLFTQHQLKGRKVKKESLVLDIDDDVTEVDPVNAAEAQAHVEEVTPVVEESTTVATSDEVIEAEIIAEEPQFKGF